MNLHAPRRLDWIKQSGGRALFMVHDLFPISYPEYYNREQARLHRRRIETMARIGDIIVFNSNATKSAWDDYVKDTRLPRPPGAVVPLGVDRIFLDRVSLRRMPDGPPYFVVLGTIEARKNLSFLLQVWREWVRRSGKPMARLVIVGRRRSSAESAVDLLERCPDLESSVIEVAEVADIRVARLLKGARALLAPSLAEGFGLPVAEALGLGVPVIASNIDAHREAGGSAVDYLDPLDGAAWVQALDDYAEASSPRRQAALARVAAHIPRSWDQHIAVVEDLMRQAVPE
jgi:glycosyltransferase involved in cell wall biosynthesis